MDPTTFISKLDAHKGLAPLNKFMAKVTFPSGLTSDKQGDLTYFCDSAPMPGRTMATSELRHYGPTRKMAREMTFAEFQLGFMMTNSQAARNSFLEWMDYIIDPVTANIRYQNEYKGTVKVYMFDQSTQGMNAGSATLGAEYQQAFPTNVDPIALGWDQLNQVGKFSVNFQYKKWQPISGLGHNNPNKAAFTTTKPGT